MRVLRRLRQDGRLARQLADQDAALVADQRRVDVLVAGRDLGDGVGVHAALVGEGAGADERLAGAEVHVGHLVDVARHLRQPLQAAGLQHLVAALQGQVGDDADEVDVAAALADAVDRPLHLRRALATAASVLATATSQSLWQWMPISTPAALRALRRPRSAISLGQRAAVGVAQDDARSPRRRCGGLQRLQGVLGVVLEAVEEVLGVVEHLAALRLAVGDRVARSSRRFSSSVVPSTSRTCRSQVLPTMVTTGVCGVEQRLEAGVVLGGAVLAPRHAEGGDLGVLQRQLADLLEVLEVLGVRERIAALDVVDAQLVEPARDAAACPGARS